MKLDAAYSDGGAKSKPSASVRGVGKRFQGSTALRNVSIDFHPGSVHVLFGENGAGKSTLIGVLAGIHKQDEGSVMVDGQEIRAAGPRQARDLGISAVFQEPALVPQLSVTENLTLGREPVTNGFIQMKTRRRIALEALERIGSSISPDSYPRDLSRAEQQFRAMPRC
jgi:ABC-type sugar transport system ATPase subunit